MSTARELDPGSRSLASTMIRHARCEYKLCIACPPTAMIASRPGKSTSRTGAEMSTRYAFGRSKAASAAPAPPGTIAVTGVGDCASMTRNPAPSYTRDTNSPGVMRRTSSQRSIDVPWPSSMPRLAPAAPSKFWKYVDFMTSSMVVPAGKTDVASPSSVAAKSHRPRCSPTLPPATPAAVNRATAALLGIANPWSVMYCRSRPASTALTYPS
nr:hypothetical protein [Candidatus Sigynarchaeum springense]